MQKLKLHSVALAAAIMVLPVMADAQPVTVPFDFSRHQIGLTVNVRGTPLYMFLDTGASPSAIDTARAKSLGLKIDFANGGEASGQGDATHVFVYPTSIDGLTVGGERIGAIEALAADQKAISNAYGRPVDGTLGHSFLIGRLTMIDYPARTLTVADRKAELAPLLATCRRSWITPLRSFKGDTIPIVDVSIGNAHLPVGIDTGSDSALDLLTGALDVPDVKAALVEAGTHKATGDRGEYTVKLYKLNAPVNIGPFVIPAGQSVALSSDAGSATTRLANVGNRLLESMRLKLLVDYPDSQIAFYGDCAR